MTFQRAISKKINYFQEKIFKDLFLNTYGKIWSFSGMKSSKVKWSNISLKKDDAIQFKPAKNEITPKYFFSDFSWTPSAKMVCCT